MNFDPELVEGILKLLFYRKNEKLCNPLVDKESNSTEKKE